MASLRTGRAFLPQAQALLQAARQARLTARDAATSREFTIGYVEDLVITQAVRQLRHRYPSARIRTRHPEWNDAHALTDRRVDALVARAPLPAMERLRPPGAPPGWRSGSQRADRLRVVRRQARLVAEERTVLILAAGDRRPQLRPDLVTVPIEGIDPVRVVLATRAADANPLINDFLNAWPSDAPAPRGR